MSQFKSYEINKMNLIIAKRMLPYIDLFLESGKGSFVCETRVYAWWIVVLDISFMFASNIAIVVVMSLFYDSSAVSKVSFHMLDDTFFFTVWFFRWLAVFTQHFSHLRAQRSSSESIWIKDRNNYQNCC